MLNQSYEPILICSVKKALLLLLLDKAEVVEVRNGSVIRSVRAAYPFPSVIRLHAYIRVPYKKVELSRRNILRRDGFACQYCGTRSAPLTIDHVIPARAVVRIAGRIWSLLVSLAITARVTARRKKQACGCARSHENRITSFFSVTSWDPSKRNGAPTFLPIESVGRVLPALLCPRRVGATRQLQTLPMLLLCCARREWALVCCSPPLQWWPPTLPDGLFLPRSGDASFSASCKHNMVEIIQHCTGFFTEDLTPFLLDRTITVAPVV